MAKTKHDYKCDVCGKSATFNLQNWWHEYEIDNKGELSTPTMCPNCGSKATWNNSSGEIQCDSCGYSETE